MTALGGLQGLAIETTRRSLISEQTLILVVGAGMTAGRAEQATAAAGEAENETGQDPPQPLVDEARHDDALRRPGQPIRRCQRQANGDAGMLKWKQWLWPL